MKYSPPPPDKSQSHRLTGCVADPVMCLVANTCQTADPGVASSILAQSNTSVHVDHDINSRVILSPSADSRGVVVSYKRKYVQEVLVNFLVNLSQEKLWFGKLTMLT